MRLIDADEARDVGKYIPWCEWDLVAEAIDEIPTADAEPVVHANWEFNENQMGIQSAIIYHCSKCGRILRVPWGNKASEYAPYCHCGAKMGEVSEE